MRKICLTLIVYSMLFTPAVQAKLYKWVDENGQVHYTDKVPTQYLTQHREVLNDQGAIVKDIKRALTPEEKEALKLEEKTRKEKEKVRLEQQRRDRILTDTYTTERDLVAARDARLEAIDSQINLAESIVKDSSNQVESTEKLITQLKAQGKQVPDATYAKLEREHRQLATQKEVAEKHKLKRKEIVEQFDGYIVRFRELMDARERGIPAKAK
jgi:phage-related minor tail protein